MKVRFIVQSFSAWNRNGWSHRCAIITATATGKRLFVAHVGGDDNVRHAIGKVTGDANYPAILNLVTDVKTREYQRLNREHEGQTIYEGDITAKTLKALETEGGE